MILDWGKENYEDLDKTQVKLFPNSSSIPFNYLSILLHEKFFQFDWVRAVVFQLNLKYLHVKITKLLQVVV